VCQKNAKKWMQKTKKKKKMMQEHHHQHSMRQVEDDSTSRRNALNWFGFQGGRIMLNFKPL
jgi:hypothetical protein